MDFGIYCRKSYFKDTSDSVGMQLSECQAFISRHFAPEEVSSVTVYQDDGYIRSNMDRPGMNKLKEDVDAGLIGCVVIYKIDRVCSKMIDFCTFYAFLTDHKVKFITVKDGIDTTTPMGEAMMYLAVVFSNLEVRTDSLRITDNMRHLASAGYWCGGQPPLGYKIVPVSKGNKSHKTLEFDPAGIEYYQSLVSIFLENNFTISAMATYCRAHGIQSRSGKNLCSTTIYRLLDSPYCVEDTPAMYDWFEGMGCIMDPEHPRSEWDGSHGIILYGQMEKTAGKAGAHVQAPPTSWRISPGVHLPFQTAENYFRIQDQFHKHTFTKKSRNPRPFLKGVLRCKCGRLMSYCVKHRADGDHTYYFCTRRALDGSCDMPYTPAELLDDQVMHIFRQIGHDPATVDKYLKDPQKAPKNTSNALRKSIEDVQRRIEALTASLAENSSSTAAKYIVVEIEKLDAEYNELRRKQMDAAAEERRQAAARIEAQEKRDEIIRLLDDFDQFTPEERNQIAVEVIKECVWDGSTLSIVL
ncbi:MAG: recombinase family protein [Clostridia bacterium]|nr:recombinase family protein [Clostridia bacterium]